MTSQLHRKHLTTVPTPHNGAGGITAVATFASLAVIHLFIFPATAQQNNADPPSSELSAGAFRVVREYKPSAPLNWQSPGNSRPVFRPTHDSPLATASEAITNSPSAIPTPAAARNVPPAELRDDPFHDPFGDKLTASADSLWPDPQPSVVASQVGAVENGTVTEVQVRHPARTSSPSVTPTGHRPITLSLTSADPVAVIHDDHVATVQHQQLPLVSAVVGTAPQLKVFPNALGPQNGTPPSETTSRQSLEPIRMSQGIDGKSTGSTYADQILRELDGLNQDSDSKSKSGSDPAEEVEVESESVPTPATGSKSEYEILPLEPTPAKAPQAATAEPPVQQQPRPVPRSQAPVVKSPSSVEMENPVPGPLDKDVFDLFGEAPPAEVDRDSEMPWEGESAPPVTSPPVPSTVQPPASIPSSNKNVVKPTLEDVPSHNSTNTDDLQNLLAPPTSPTPSTDNPALQNDNDATPSADRGRESYLDEGLDPDDSDMQIDPFRDEDFDDPQPDSDNEEQNEPSRPADPDAGPRPPADEPPADEPPADEPADGWRRPKPDSISSEKRKKGERELPADAENSLGDDKKITCDRIYNRRDCCAASLACQNTWDKIRNSDIRNIRLDSSPPFDPSQPTYADEERVRMEELQQAPSRIWLAPDGRFLAVGQLVDLRDGRVHIRQENGEVATVSYYELGDDELCFVSAWWGLPNECRIRGEQLVIRDWTMTTFTWKASALCHKPLYFEDEQLERYGHSAGPLKQPLCSGAHFFANIALMPYNMAIHPPQECVYALGHYRPGNCAPWLRPAFPISRRAVLAQTAMVLGVWGVLH